MKFPDFTFEGGCKQMTTIFLSLLKFGLSQEVRIRLSEHCGTFVLL